MKYYDLEGKEISEIAFLQLRERDILMYGNAFCLRTPGGVRLLDAAKVFMVK